MVSLKTYPKGQGINFWNESQGKRFRSKSLPHGLWNLDFLRLFIFKIFAAINIFILYYATQCPVSHGVICLFPRARIENIFDYFKLKVLRIFGPSTSGGHQNFNVT